MYFLPEYGPWWSIYISPEEDYLIFSGGENADLYIRFKNNTDQWGEPVNLGGKINTVQWERFPYVSPDGKYLFFTRGNSDESNLYWVSTAIIDSLKKTSITFAPNSPNILQAVAAGDLNNVRTLLEADPTLLKSKDNIGNTPLITACLTTQVAVAKAELKKIY
jgi:hypothetical protein